MPATTGNSRAPKTSRRELTPAQRAEIIGAHRLGVTAPEIAARLGYKQPTVYYTLRMAEKREDNKSRPRGGPRKTDAEKDKLLAEVAMAAPTQPLRDLNRNVVPEVSVRTVQRRLKEKTIQKYRARKKPRLTGRHRSLRLQWALEHVDWEHEQWGKIVWSDECSIELGSGQARPYVFRLQGNDYLDTDFVERRTHGTRVMIWAAFHGTTKSEAVYLPGDPNSARRGVTAERILACLKEHLPPLMEGEGKIFMMDGASVHTAGIVQDWLKEKGYTVMEWPPYSPDLNPIEHLWFPTKEGIYPLTETIEELRGEDNKKRLMAAEACAAWDRIPASKLDRFVATMQARCRAVIKAGGGHTKY